MIKQQSVPDYLSHRVRSGSGSRRLQPLYRPAKTTWQMISEILELARHIGKEGPVAKHLVGAKLQIRFPNVLVANEPYDMTDARLGRAGDFKLGDTAFHIMVAPMPAVFDKCKANINAGLRAYLIVPERLLMGTRQYADLVLPGRIAVESLESFIGQNVEQLGWFSQQHVREQIKLLLTTYNDRVDAGEADKSLMIEIPPNL